MYLLAAPATYAVVAALASLTAMSESMGPSSPPPLTLRAREVVKVGLAWEMAKKARSREKIFMLLSGVDA